MKRGSGSLKLGCLLFTVSLVGGLLGCAGVDSNRPVATIDGENVITAGDYLYRYHRALDKAPLGNKPQINTLDDARAFLDDLITGRVLELEAEARGFDEDPVFKRDVATHRRKVLNNMLTEDILAEITVTENDLREYFNRSTHPRYIGLIVTKSKERAEKAKKALDSGRAFEDVVEEFSEDVATKKTGGKNPAPIYYKIAPVHKAIFELEDKGDYTDVIYREFYDMYFIYRYEGDAEPVELEYEKEKENMREKLETYLTENIISESVEELRDDVKIERNGDVYDDVLSLSPAEVKKRHYNPFTVIATVGKTPIYFDDFWDAFVYRSKLSRVDVDVFRKSDPESFEEVIEKVLDVFIRQALVEAEAERRGITEREEFVREMNRFRGVRLIDRMNEEVFFPTVPKVTDEEVVAYFEEHKSSYAVPEAMEGRCIILKNRSYVGELHTVAGTGGFKTATEKAFVYLAGKYGEESLKGPLPATRDEIVARFRVTKDPSYQVRGEAEEPEYLTRLREYVFDYPEGVLSPVVDLKDGRYLIFLNEKYTTYKERSLDDKGVYPIVKADAQTEVNMSEETDRKSREWFADLKAKHKIEIDEGVLKAIYKEIQKEKG
jgi:peptidyl-prolyl cis-trans isomerase C